MQVRITGYNKQMSTQIVFKLAHNETNARGLNLTSHVPITHFFRPSISNAVKRRMIITLDF